MRLLLAAAFAAGLVAPAMPAAASPEAGKARAFSHAMQPGAVAEECLRLEAGRSRAFEWQADGPLDFNIHYHEGDKVHTPLKANGRDRGKGRFTASSAQDYCWMWTAKRPTTLSGTLGAEQ